MTQSNRLMKAFNAFAVTSLVLLAGCAQQHTVADSEQPSALKEDKAKAKTVEKTGAVQTVAAEEAVPDYANMNPVPIAFDKMSIKLRDADKQILVKIKDRAQKAKRLVITGYCDRKQVGNSKDAAIARAVAVKQELVRLGVKPGMVRIKHVTSVANKHAAEIELVTAT